MTKFYIHIGTHKTGSTTIQHLLSENRDTLVEAGIDFPLLGRQPAGAQSHRHFSAFCRGLTAEYPPQLPQALEEGITPLDRCIVTSEDFYFIYSQSEFDRFKYIFKDPYVLCYFREPIDHIRSMYLESLKHGNAQTPDKFVDFHSRRMMGTGRFSFYSYRSNYMVWRGRFEIEAVRYERVGLVDDFIERLGLQSVSAGWQRETNANQSVDRNVAGVQILVNLGLQHNLLTKSEWKILKKEIFRRTPHIEKNFDLQLNEKKYDLTDFAKKFSQFNEGFLGLDPDPRAEMLFFDIDNVDLDVEIARIRDFLASP